MLYVAALRDSGQIDAAIAQAREVLLTAQPGDAAALSELALSHLAKGERDSAELLVKEALGSQQGQRRRAPHRGARRPRQGRRRGGVRLVLEGVARNRPKDTTARLNMGTVLLKAGVYRQGGRTISRGAERLQEDSDASIGLAAALRGEADKDHQSKLGEAQKLLEGVLARDPHNVAAEFNLAVLQATF